MRKNRDRGGRAASEPTTLDRASRPRGRRWLPLLCVAALLLVLLFWGRRIAYLNVRYLAIRALDRWAISSAQQWLQRARWLEPDRAEPHLMAAIGWRRLGELDLWQQALDMARQKGMPAEQLELERQLGRFATGNVPAGVEDLRLQFIEAGVPADDLSAALVTGYLEGGAYERAERILQRWDRASPDNAQVACMWGYYYFHYGDPEQAVEKLQLALAIEPCQELARMLLARLYDTANQLDLALSAYADLLQRYPTNRTARLGLASVLRQVNRSQAARAALAPLLSKTDPDPAAMLEMAQLALDQGNYEEFERWLAGFDFSEAQDMNLLTTAGMLLGLNGDTTSALAVFRRRDALAASSRRSQDLQTRLALNPRDRAAAEELQYLSIHPERGLRLGPRVPGEPGIESGSAETAQTAAELYAVHCSICHGLEGAGDGRAAQHLFPRPRNLRREPFKLVRAANGVPTRQDILDMLRRGMPGTSMPGYDQLTDEQLERLADETLRLYRDGLREQYVARLREFGEEIDEADVSAFIQSRGSPSAIVNIPPIGPADAQALDRGRQVYVDQGCTQCHASDGRGALDALLYDDSGRPTRPRDLTCEPFKGGEEPESILLRLKIGMPGTPHPATTNLSDTQLVDLVHYTRSLKQEPLRLLSNHERAVYVMVPAYLEAMGGSERDGRDRRDQSDGDPVKSVGGQSADQ